MSTNPSGAGSPAGAVDADEILRVQDVSKAFLAGHGVFSRGRGPAIRAVDGVTLGVRRGETLGVVGETGCGKSTLARLMVRLLRVTAGRVWFEGQDITHSTRRDMQLVREHVQMVFQDPYASLNPRRRIGSLIEDPLKIHNAGGRQERRLAVDELMRSVGLNPLDYSRYPREFSGGQRQRVGLARALALKPKLLILDEPVSALDVSIQAQLLNLLIDLREDFGLTCVFISHDLAVVRHVADRVAVMYLGKLVEIGDAASVYARPSHPYTAALLSATPVADPHEAVKRQRIVLLGDIPTAAEPPSGCRFHPRCPIARDVCRTDEPQLTNQAGRSVACHFPLEVAKGSARGGADLRPGETTRVGWRRDGT